VPSIADFPSITFGNTLTLTPPLITTRAQMDFAIDLIAKNLADAVQALRNG